MAVLLIVAALAACSRPPTVLDGSDQTAFERSVVQARRDLPIGDRLVFDTAMKNPPGWRYSRKSSDQLLRQSYGGMTAADVVADARARGLD